MRVNLSLHGAATAIGRSLSGGGEEEKCNSYTCPKHSTMKKGTDCLEDFDDCVCYSGYHRFDGSCIDSVDRAGDDYYDDDEYQNCNYGCPPNSMPKPGVTCSEDFDDCDCFENFKRRDDACVLVDGGGGYDDDANNNDDGDDECVFVCPEFSTALPDRNCMDDFSDCKCYDGYKKKDGRCILKEDLYPRSYYDDDDGCNFVCPRHSTPRAHRNCMDAIDDCRCDIGYRKQGDACIIASVEELEGNLSKPAGGYPLVAFAGIAVLGIATGAYFRARRTRQGFRNASLMAGTDGTYAFADSNQGLTMELTDVSQEAP